MILVKFPLVFLPGTRLVDYPGGGIAQYRRTFTDGVDVFGTFLGLAPEPEHTVLTELPKRDGEYPAYTFREFRNWLSDAEWDALIQKARANDQAAAVFESIKLDGLDFNGQRDRNLADRMVAAAILTQARRDALVNGDA